MKQIKPVQNWQISFHSQFLNCIVSPKTHKQEKNSKAENTPQTGHIDTCISPSTSNPGSHLNADSYQQQSITKPMFGNMSADAINATKWFSDVAAENTIEKKKLSSLLKTLSTGVFVFKL